MNKYVQPRPYANPEAAARKILELAHAFEPIPDGRIYIEAINGPMLYQHKATPAEYKAGIDLVIERGWLELHESGTFVRFTQRQRSVRIEKPRLEAGGWFNVGRPGAQFWAFRDGRRQGTQLRLADAP
jgi:hypothetical protein